MSKPRSWFPSCLALLSLSCGTAPASTETEPITETTTEALSLAPPVGLSLFFRNGVMQPISLVGSSRRFLQEIDIVNSVTTPTDEGPTPLVTSGLMGNADWTGLAFVEEDWREPGDGTWTRQRFYRGARWMEQTSLFVASAKNAQGHHVGLPMVFDAGSDNHWNRLFDDGFVRRFDVRQIVKGCLAQFDCTAATAFEVQGFVQVRDALHPEIAARLIPEDATSLELAWTAAPSVKSTVALTHAAPSATTYGYGFTPTLTLVSPPANGQYYLPTDQLSIRVAFLDGQGNRLHPVGSLPTYQDTLTGASAGLRYWDPTLDTVLYYALKHREGNMILQVSGPSNALAIPKGITQFGEFFAPQVNSASVPLDGYSGFAVEIPALPSVLAGFADPTQWQLPVSDVQTLTIPADAKPGTYTAVIKARREWGGEALNRGATVSFQVGNATPTTFVSETGHCDTCHEGRSSLATVNHGIGDRRTCFGCHQGLPFEPDAVLDWRIHSIHSRSDRFPGDFSKCSTCHLTPPTGPARGAFMP